MLFSFISFTNWDMHMLVLVCWALATCLTQAAEERIFNVVVLGNTGVGKSSLMNMFVQNPNLFKVGHSAMSETQLASVQECRFLGKKNGLKMRLIDTQGLSDTGGDKKDMDHIKNMVEIIRKLGYIDLFIICFDGTNPRFTAYAQSTVSLFSQIFPDFLAHSVILFNKWKNPDDSKRANLEREYQKKFKDVFHYPKIPCYFLDSNFYLKEKRWNDAGVLVESFLHPNIQERSLSKVIQLGTFLNLKKNRCDVKNIKPVHTVFSALQLKTKEAQAQLKKERDAFDKKMTNMNEANQKAMAEARKRSDEQIKTLKEDVAKANRQKKSGFLNLIRFIGRRWRSVSVGSIIALCINVDIGKSALKNTKQKNTTTWTKREIPFILSQNNTIVS